MKQNFGFLVACSLILGLSACGGGSGSKSSQPLKSSSLASSIPPSISSSAVTSSSLASSMSSVATTSSSVAAKRSARISGKVYVKSSDGTELDLDSVESIDVNLMLLDSKGDVVASTSPKIINSIASRGAPFDAEIAGVDAQIIVIKVSKAGFGDYARRFEYAPNVNVTANLEKLQEITIESTEVTSISGKQLSGFNVSVTNSNGLEEIVEGSSGAIADLSVSIPQSALPVGTTSVDVTMQAFNPNDLEDAQSFPGAYEDSTGNKLLSVAFDYTDVKTDSGLSLQKIAQDTQKSRLAAQKQSGKTISPMQFAKEKSQKSGETLEPVIINRKIPAESCASLSQLGDANTAQMGFQVPVYTYNTTNGLWDLLGYGTLFDESGNLIADNQKIFDCSNNTYVLEIEATNEIFLSNWWNLDYPLVFTQPVKLCANIELRDEGNNPVANSVLFVSDDDDLRSFSAESFVTDEKGQVQIELISLDEGADLKGTLSIYNASLYSSYKTADVTLSTSCSAPRVVVPVAVPEMCSAKGRVVDIAGTPLANRYLIAGDFTSTDSETYLFPAFAITNANGDYDLALECEQNYQIIEYFSTIFSDGGWFETDFLTNVNAAVGTFEISDNGKQVMLKDVVASVTRPLVFVSNDENSQTQIILSSVYVGNDFPLTYNFSLVDDEEKVVGQFSGSLVSTDFTSNSLEYPFPFFQKVFDHNLPASTVFAGYNVAGEITDSKGNKTPISGYVVTGDDGISE